MSQLTLPVADAGSFQGGAMSVFSPVLSVQLYKTNCSIVLKRTLLKYKKSDIVVYFITVNDDYLIIIISSSCKSIISCTY